MKLLDVMDFDENLTVKFMWEKIFFEPRAKVGAALIWKLWEKKIKKKIEKLKKRKLLNMMVPNFLYNISHPFFNMIIIILIFLLPTAIVFGLFLSQIATYKNTKN